MSATETKQKVTVITAVQNNKPFLKDCMKSVQKQTYKYIEHIVVDCCSTDGSKESISELGSNFLLYEEAQITCLNQALNFALGKMTGDIVCVLHPKDQLYGSDTIEKVVKVFNDNKINVLYGKGVFIDGRNVLKTIRSYGSKSHETNHLTFGNIPLHTTIYVHKTLLKDIVPKNHIVNFKSEYELYLRLFMHPDIQPYFLNDFIVKMTLYERRLVKKKTEQLREPLTKRSKNHASGLFFKHAWE